MSEEFTKIELTKEEQDAFNKLLFVIAQDLASGVRKEEVINKLVKENLLSRDTAIRLVNDVETMIEEQRKTVDDESRYELLDKFKKKMIYGILWAIGGSIVTLGTYSAVSETGGTYFVAWGAILFGIVDFISGLYGFFKYRT